jgi:hypothetical protein
LVSYNIERISGIVWMIVAQLGEAGDLGIPGIELPGLITERDPRDGWLRAWRPE